MTNQPNKKNELPIEVQSSYASVKEKSHKLKSKFRAFNVNMMQKENSNNENMKKNRMTIDHLQRELFKY